MLFSKNSRPFIWGMRITINHFECYIIFSRSIYLSFLLSIPPSFLCSHRPTPPLMHWVCKKCFLLRKGYQYNQYYTLNGTLLLYLITKRDHFWVGAPVWCISFCYQQMAMQERMGLPPLETVAKKQDHWSKMTWTVKSTTDILLT